MMDRTHRGYLAMFLLIRQRVTQPLHVQKQRRKARICTEMRAALGIIKNNPKANSCAFRPFQVICI